MARIVQASMSGGKQVRNLSHRPNLEDLAFIRELLEAGRVAPVIDRRYPLAEVAEAFRHYGGGGARGKVIITV